MPRLPETNKKYMRKYYSDPEKRRLKRLRDNDRYAYEKKNWRIPKWKELAHVGGYGKWPKRLQTRKKNRSDWARTTNRVRKKVN